MCKPLILRTETISRPGAAIRVERIVLTPEGKRALSCGRAEIPRPRRARNLSDVGIHIALTIVNLTLIGAYIWITS